MLTADNTAVNIIARSTLFSNMPLGLTNRGRMRIRDNKVIQ